MTRGSVLAMVATLLVGGVLAAPTSADQLAGPGSVFRVEWDVPPLPPSRAKLEGYVYNDSLFQVTNVRLRVVSLDGAGQTIGEMWGWVFGDIPAGGRAYFAASLAQPAATYRVTVSSFDLVSSGG